MITIKAYAKLNLFVHIDPVRDARGYFPAHFIDSQLALHDIVLIETLDNDIELICDNANVGPVHDNFAYCAACLFKSQIGRADLGARITLKKEIPIKAGFGGGSSDAAAVVLGLSRLWGVECTDEHIKDLAAQLGKDFFYSLRGGLCDIVSQGKAYYAQPLCNTFKNIWIIIIMPDEVKPSTAWVYASINPVNLGNHKEAMVQFKRHLLNNEPQALHYVHNDFETDMIAFFSVIQQMKNDLMHQGALAAIMAGAGLSMVGFFSEYELAQQAKARLEKYYTKIWITQLI